MKFGFLKRIKNILSVENRKLRIGWDVYYNNGNIFIPFSIWLNGKEYKPNRPICIEVKDRDDAEAIMRMISKCAGKKLFQLRMKCEQCSKDRDINDDIMKMKKHSIKSIERYIFGPSEDKES